MLSIEKKILDWCEKHMLLLFAGIISFLAYRIRYNGMNMTTVDYWSCLEPWFSTIAAKGGLPAISEQVGNYNVLYQLLICLLTYIPVLSLYLYKWLSVAFDYLLALAAGLTAYELCHQKIKAVLVYCGVLLLPSVFINSAYWAQCDSIYCFFLILSVYFLLKQRYTLTFIFFSIAFQFKLQAIFFLPFLLYYYVRTRSFSLLQFLWVPALGVLICLLCGRGPLDSITIYLDQTNVQPGMAHNFPSVWNLITSSYEFFRGTSMRLTIAILGVGLLLILHTKMPFTRENILNVMIWSLWTCLLFLPSMHERYAYFLIILLLIASVINFRMMGVYWLGTELIILVCYANCLWNDTYAENISPCLYSALFFALYLLFTHQQFFRRKSWLTESEV
ncbi:MAG: hypothetical protein IJB85_02640 [Clostridia bacterium]|nr:hypothetical protein [Clostridia bacterium]